MFAYVRDMRAETKKDIKEKTGKVPASKLFELLETREKRRMKFNPLRFNPNKRYSVLIGTKLVRHLVLKYADTEEELTKLVKADSRLRQFKGIPKRKSITELVEDVDAYELVEESDETIEEQTQQANVTEQVTNERNDKLKRKKKMAENNNIKKKKQKGESIGTVGEELPGGFVSSLHKKDTIAKQDEDIAGLVVKKQISAASNEETRQPMLHQPHYAQGQRDCQNCRRLEILLQKKNEEGEDEERDCKNCRRFAVDISETKRMVTVLYENSNLKKKTVCPLNELTDVAPFDGQYTIPNNHVHIGGGTKFINKKALVQLERQTGLRPRLKGLIKLFYKDDYYLWTKSGMDGHGKGSKEVNKITMEHIRSMTDILLALGNWKEVAVTYESVDKEITKATTELKKERLEQLEKERVKKLKEEEQGQKKTHQKDEAVPGTSIEEDAARLKEKGPNEEQKEGAKDNDDKEGDHTLSDVDDEEDGTIQRLAVD